MTTRDNPAMLIAFEMARLLERAFVDNHLTGGSVGFALIVRSEDIGSMDQLSPRYLAPVVANAVSSLTEGRQRSPHALPPDMGTGWPVARYEPSEVPPMAAIMRSIAHPFVVRARVWPNVMHDAYELRIEVAALTEAA